MQQYINVFRGSPSGDWVGYECVACLKIPKWEAAGAFLSMVVDMYCYQPQYRADGQSATALTGITWADYFAYNDEALPEDSNPDELCDHIWFDIRIEDAPRAVDGSYIGEWSYPGLDESHRLRDLPDPA